MAHVTSIHGIGQKPAKDLLLGIWRRALTRSRPEEHPAARGATGDEIDLGAEGVRSSMIYWADVLYPAPDPNVAAHESRDEFEALASDVAVLGQPITLKDAEDPEWLASLAGKLYLQEEMQEDAVEPVPDAPVDQKERILLPWAIKQRFLAAFLRDVHHYLFDIEYGPRPGETYRVRQEIRKRFVSELNAAAADGAPHVVVSHSMGTVIAYDCLKNVPECPRIDALITLGSPLGIDEVQDKLAPGWSRHDGFPGEKAGEWVNVFDRLDVVCALDPLLANDFCRAGAEAVRDIEEPNHGRWRHSVRKYFEGPQLRSELRRLLKL
jgi:hypothetical protein